MAFNNVKKVLGIFILVSLTGCFSSDDDYEYGYNDGYAAGYNTTCKIRATMIKGDWDDEDYSRGYRAGYEDGAFDCRNRKK